MELTTRDRAILDFEGMWWQIDGSKQDAIRTRFALSPTRYYQLLNQLLDSPQAMTYNPLVVRRLKRLRADRRRARHEGSAAEQPPGN